MAQFRAADGANLSNATRPGNLQRPPVSCSGNFVDAYLIAASFAEISAVEAGVPQLGASLPSPHARGR
jgi:hypothetical protein